MKLSINSAGEDFTIGANYLVGDALDFEGKLRYVSFTIIRPDEDVSGDAVAKPLRSINEVLHGGTPYVYVKRKNLFRMTNKGKLYDAVVDDLEKSGVKFHAYKSDKEVEKCVRALWHIDATKTNVSVRTLKSCL